MTVGLVGSGPALEAVAATLADVDVPTTDVEPTSRDAGPVVVAGLVGDGVFERVNEHSLSLDRPWIAIEYGGVGGHRIPGVEVGIAGFVPGAACFRCLGTRVAATEAVANETAPTDGWDQTDDEEAVHDRADPGNVEDSPEAGTLRIAGAIAGRALVRLDRGDGSLPFGGVIELPYAERSVLPVPGCPACGQSSDDASRYGVEAGALPFEERSLEDALARAERALDARTGVVASVGEIASFPAPYYLATLGETDGFSDASAAPQAAGVALDWNEAFMKALGEALERYCAGVYRTDSFEYARPTEVADAVAPSAFVSSEPVADDESIPWTAGRDLRTGEPVSLPAEYVHFPPPERRFRPSITTGLGLGNSPVGAILSGLYEVIERDAAMLSWYSTGEPLGLTVADEAFETLARRVGSESLDVSTLLVTQDVDVPVVSVAVHREGEWPRFAVGSGAALDPVAAARSALCEATQNWMELRSMGEDAANEASGWIGHYASFPDAARAFLSVEATVPATSVGPASVPTGPAELAAVVERVDAAGLSPYVAWLTPRDIRSIGFEAARVVVPEAQPLFTGSPFFGERARRIPRELGFEPRLDREPHPYP